MEKSMLGREDVSGNVYMLCLYMMTIAKEINVWRRSQSDDKYSTYMITLSEGGLFSIEKY